MQIWHKLWIWYTWWWRTNISVQHRQIEIRARQLPAEQSGCWSAATTRLTATEFSQLLIRYIYLWESPIDYQPGPSVSWIILGSLFFFTLSNFSSFRILLSLLIILRIEQDTNLEIFYQTCWYCCAFNCLILLWWWNNHYSFSTLICT